MRLGLTAVLVLLAACSAEPVFLPDASTPDADSCGGVCGAGTICLVGRCVVPEDGGVDAGAGLDAGPSDTGGGTDVVDVPVVRDATPDVSAVPDLPTVTDVPTLDAAPDVLAASDVPAVPDVPTAPDVPPIDAAPDVPVVPDVPTSDGPTATTLRPLGPLTGAHAPSRRPTLRWALPTGVAGVRVTLCRDRALTIGCTSFDATGTTGTPATDLAPGVWYWGLRALAGGAPTGAVSAVWRLRVASATTSGARAWGGDADFNGDGYADVLVTAPEVSVSIYAGGPSGLATTPTTIPSPLDSTGFGLSADFAGDFDGDGYGDLVVGSPGSEAVYLYRGSPGGVLPAPTTIVGPRGSSLGSAVAGVGDVDGDGYDDVAAANPVGRAVWVIPGGAAGAGAPVRVSGLDAAATSFSSTALEGVGDVDGDGFADVLLANRSSGAVLLRGAATGLDAARTVVVPSSTSPAGDLNNDGLADLAHWVSGWVGVLGARAFTGAGTPVPGSNTFTGTEDAAPLQGGDYNGDGYDDLAGFGSFVPWGPTGPGAPVALVSGFGTATINGLVGAGDVDGDGFDDMLSRARFDSVLFLTRGNAAGLALGLLTYSDLRSPTGSFDASTPLIAVGDIDHDGHADLALGTTFFRGSAAGFVRAPTWTVGRAGETVPGVARVGDVNHDGYDDVLAFGSQVTSGGFYTQDRYFLTLGSPSGPTGARSDFGASATGHLGLSPVPFLGYAGDLNGDGFADGLLPAYSSLVGTVAGNYFTGRATFPATTTPTSQPRANPTFAGDLNRDGYSDLLYTDSASNRRVLFGSATGPVEAVGGFSASSVAALGDVNGDGYADLATGAEVHFGSATGPTAAVGMTLTTTYSLRAVGDVNGDGYADCVGEYRPSAITTTALYLGSVTGLTAVGALRAPDRPTVLQNNEPIGFGDVDGDGRSDLVLRAPRGVVIQRFGPTAPRPATLTVGTETVVYR